MRAYDVVPSTECCVQVRAGMKPSLVVIATAAMCPLLSAAPTPERPRPEPPNFEHGMMVRFHMHENYGMFRAIERLLLRGRLDDAKFLASGIGEAPDEPGLSAFVVYEARVRTRAQDIVKAKDLDQAIRRSASLAEACASCHVASGQLPELAIPSGPPPDRDTLDARMARHLWAADQLGAGILASDDKAWTSGLELLGSSPPLFGQLTKEQAVLGKQLQQAAKTTLKAKPKRLDEKADAYGGLLVICASCHAAGTP
jgi:cytochrome c553